MSELTAGTDKVNVTHFENGEEVTSELTSSIDQVILLSRPAHLPFQLAMYIYTLEGLLVMLFNIFMFTRIMTVRDLRQQKE